ncbi:MAG: hypothetical protein R3266_10925 [Gemmatimonadota bacterium]|nr:hypothetical protein [Gemmatimonadota bacterium]
MLRTVRRSAGALLLAALALAAASGSATAQDASPVGDWEGTLVVPGAELPLVLHVTEGEDGSLEATLDSPAQGAYGIEGADAVFEEGSLTIGFPQIMGDYEGTMSEDGNTLTGTWSQLEQSFDLVLTRSEG